MITLVQSPAWFYGESIIIHFLSAAVLALVAFVALRFYLLRQDKKWLQFGTSFAILATAFFGQVVLFWTLHARQYAALEGGVLNLSIYFGLPASVFLFLSIVGMRFLLLYGLVLLYFTYRETPPKMHALVIYLLGVLTYFTAGAYYVFHLTALVLMLMIMTEYVVKFRENNNKITKLLAWSFGILTISQLAFIFSLHNPMYDVFGEVIQLLGFLFLLYTVILVRRHGKKITT